MGTCSYVNNEIQTWRPISAIERNLILILRKSAMFGFCHAPSLAHESINTGFPSSFPLLAVQATESWKGSLGLRLKLEGKPWFEAKVKLEGKPGFEASHRKAGREA